MHRDLGPLCTIAVAHLGSGVVPRRQGYSLVGVLGGMAFEPYYMTDNTLLSQLNHISDQDCVPA